jgi:hypothetical protein
MAERVRSYADVDPQEPDMLIPRMAARGTVTIVGGWPGTSKSSLGASLTGLLTTGRPVPGATGRREPEGVIMVTPEDSAECSMVWRLKEAGADLRLVYDMTETEAGDFLVERDLPRLRRKIAEAAEEDCGVAMVWIDPLSGAAETSLQSPKVRPRLMAPLGKFAEDTGTAVFVVQHNRKDGELGGNQELKNAARSVITLTVDPDDDRLRVATLTKSNVAKTGTCIRYRLEGEPPRTRVIYVDGEPAATSAAEPTVITASNMSPERQIIVALETAASNGTPAMRLQALALCSGVAYPRARTLAPQMAAAGKIRQVASNAYAAVSRPATAAADAAGLGALARTAAS